LKIAGYFKNLSFLIPKFEHIYEEKGGIGRIHQSYIFAN